LLGATALVYALAEGGGIAVPTLAARRQVPEWWRTFFSPPSAAALYGAGLGVGFATSLSHGTYVVVCTAALLSGDPLAGALLCGPFGLTRAAASAVGGARDPAGAVDRLDALATTRLPRALNGAALATLAVAALTS
jgi:hypothetical protein